jgi:hypothetical protein
MLVVVVRDPRGRGGSGCNAQVGELLDLEDIPVNSGSSYMLRNPIMGLTQGSRIWLNRDEFTPACTAILALYGLENLPVGREL